MSDFVGSFSYYYMKIVFIVYCLLIKHLDKVIDNIL